VTHGTTMSPQNEMELEEEQPTEVTPAKNPAGTRYHRCDDCMPVKQAWFPQVSISSFHSSSEELGKAKHPQQQHYVTDQHEHKFVLYG
jgi:hypothetical protein